MNERERDSIIELWVWSNTCYHYVGI